MAIARFAGCTLTCLSGDTKPTANYLAGWRCIETDTGSVFYNDDGSAWVKISGKDLAETLTGKTIAAGDNTLTGITSTSLPATVVYTDQTNTFGAFAQIFPSSQFKIQNPLASKAYTFAGSAIIDDRTITLPLLGGSDTMVCNDNTATLTNKTLTAPVISSISNTGTLTLPSGTTDTIVARATTDTLENKTINASDNTITDDSIAQGDILKSNGTKFIRLGKGNADQVLTVRSDGTDVEWKDPTAVGGVSASDPNTWSAIQTFNDGMFHLRNPLDTFCAIVKSGAQVTSDKTFTFPVTASDTIVVEAATQTLTGKTIAAGSNTISGIVDTNIDSHTSTKITITDKTHLNSATVYTDQANTFGAYTNIFGGSLQTDLYHDIKTVSIPSAPATNYIRVYAKAIDAQNYGLYGQVLENNVTNEIRIF